MKGFPLPKGMAPYIAINLRNTRGSFVGKSASSRCFRVQNSYRSADVLLGNFCLLTRRFSTCLPQLYIQHTYVLGLTSKPLHLATLYVPPPREICPPLRCAPRLSVPLLLFTTTPPRAILVRTHTSQAWHKNQLMNDHFPPNACHDSDDA